VNRAAIVSARCPASIALSLVAVDGGLFDAIRHEPKKQGRRPADQQR
jgi:hypothetical protein